MGVIFLKKVIFLVFLIILFSVSFIFAKNSTYSFEQNYEVVAVYTKDGLTITSYSKFWPQAKLRLLYDELTQNFTSSEFDYLKNIYLYPDSPEGVNGHYFEDVYIENGKYVFGEDSYINIYNADKLTTIAKIAPVLSHEYGHHYFLFNLLKTENIYSNNIINSKYAKIRQIESFPTFYAGGISSLSEYYWDVLEIAADDYVQLLGSPNARASIDYKSVDELITNKYFDNSQIAFNLKPSLNPSIPLASEVDGLYSYFLELGGYTYTEPSLKQYPVLSDVSVSETIDGNLSFKISFTSAVGNGPFEYTLIMYPESNPLSPIPLKTLKTGEKLEVTFGSYAVKNEDGTIDSITNDYTGKFKIKLYIKDSNNFIYSTDEILFDFDNAKNLLSKQITETTTEATTETKKEVIFIGPKKPTTSILSNLFSKLNS